MAMEAAEPRWGGAGPPFGRRVSGLSRGAGMVSGPDVHELNAVLADCSHIRDLRLPRGVDASADLQGFPPAMKRHRFRTVFLSDVHLGSRGCRAEELQAFLKRISCDELYLVGDIVDFWRIRKRAFWPDEHNEVLRRILKLAHRGTRVVMIPGNHDEAVRGFAGQSFGGIEIRREAVHECRDGRRLLIAHGDEYDLVVRQARLLSLAGAWGYEVLIVLDRRFRAIRRRMGRKEWSLAQAIKLRVKSACTFVSRFEEALAQVARSRGLDGVVCGHVHQPAIGRLEGDVAYFNCGDWIENCTALVETMSGQLQLIGRDFRPLDCRALAGGLVGEPAEDAGEASAAAAVTGGGADEPAGVRPRAGRAWMPVSELDAGLDEEDLDDDADDADDADHADDMDAGDAGDAAHEADEMVAVPQVAVRGPVLASPPINATTATTAG